MLDTLSFPTSIFPFIQLLIRSSLPLLAMYFVFASCSTFWPDPYVFSSNLTLLAVV
jgi:hypothetical protein